MKKTLVFTFAFSCIFNAQSLFAQHGGTMNHWYFGWFASMEFTTGSPVATPDSDMICEEGSATMSDEAGNLLFYTNGGGDSNNPWPGGVWNRNHELMPNGDITGLTGSDSSPQSSLIIQKSATEYYLFTIGASPTPVGVRVSIVDMSLDGGLGDLTLVGDPVLDPPPSPLAEGMTATEDAEGTGHWLVVHSSSGNTFYVMHVTPTGISSPTTYNIGSGLHNSGQIKFSVQGDRLAQDDNIFDFDNATGVISNPINLGFTNSFGWGGWGRAFSPSGRFFYMGELGPNGDVFQYDLMATDIPASKVLLGSSSAGVSGPMQLGPDLKIYFSLKEYQSLAAITDPDLPGTSCNFVSDYVPLTGNSQVSIPNFIDSDLRFAAAGKISKKQSIILAPNPTGDFLYLSSDHQSDEPIFIFDLSGKQLSNWSLDGSNKIDVRNLNPGIYLIRQGAASAQFVKE
ncbi:MAG: T9SS type A sorting domain-containing protein [Flavobacteriales bacterium]|nr:T9SS type A sorting domain-containing protein [Flavobacteriales bacterium]